MCHELAPSIGTFLTLSHLWRETLAELSVQGANCDINLMITKSIPQDHIRLQAELGTCGSRLAENLECRRWHLHLQRWCSSPSCTPTRRWLFLMTPSLDSHVECQDGSNGVGRFSKQKSRLAGLLFMNYDTRIVDDEHPGIIEDIFSQGDMFQGRS